MKRSAVRALPERRAGSPVAARLAGTAATL
ncbi:flagellar biosynthesis protein FliO, partial [Burkholderia sp. Cy-647]|nr:flagellar biosynthesis protein FliO [Burkholderia sp. Cy-647]